jgi:hypothetical protein
MIRRAEQVSANDEVSAMKCGKVPKNNGVSYRLGEASAREGGVSNRDSGRAIEGWSK